MDPGVKILLVAFGLLLLWGAGSILVAWAMSNISRPPW